MNQSEDTTRGRIVVGSGSGDDAADTFQDIALSTATLVHSIGNNDIYAVEIADKPSGDAVRLQFRQPITVGADEWSIDGSNITNKTLVPLKMAGDNPVAGRALLVNTAGDGFRYIAIGSTRTVFEGQANGVTISGGATSAVVRTNLDETLNILNENHGVVGVFLELGIAEGASSNTLGFNTPGNTEEDIDGFLPNDVLARSTAFLASSSEYGLTVVDVDVFDGSTLAGVYIARLARDSSGVVGFNDQFVRESGSTSTANFTINVRATIVVWDSGAPLGHAGGAALRQFAAYPSQDDINAMLDGDIVVVYGGSQIGIYRKSSSTVHAQADTGLAGEDFNPTGAGANGDFLAAGRYDHIFYARTNTNSDRDNQLLAANAADWTDAPAALNLLDFNYRATTRQDGELRLEYSSARTYTGEIVVTAGTAVVHLARISSTVWSVTGLNAAFVAALRENTWRFSEPGQTGSVTTHTLTQVGAP